MTHATTQLYIIALGSNQYLPKYGGPDKILMRAAEILECDEIDVLSFSKIITSRAIGPSKRNYANAAALICTPLPPQKLLRHLKNTENLFGRKSRKGADIGQKWRSRPLDLDIITWSGGCFVGDSPSLIIPHPMMTNRDFVLGPAAQIAGKWRDPHSGFSISQIFFQKNRSKPLDQFGKGL
ncbi:2-amino-4-hydroxy-6-hydroxymethyldihydropteridine diphosphokinase [Sphingorhabdus lutea]|uniref:2-amino-4-hydroxy-6-hydroxymethyldihydropteridine pyrophosphokinase n=1 Tax=Sphingorhabdus lutea TaxID=1913578 RepID=A0A1L3JCK9_9SPHN|nr:2-amino-4-hydroxy-6-hydroxymethyldihydropteridine diphosphokinase [Sphingorhabdus lutea]APG62875.1 2-amino-4-hydroxy-6-hydroxymethyldihydropteridine diphosphokinase [Sphingorhabdus lutea]